jgi:hypothetical protein
MSVLGLYSGYTVKYNLRLQEFPWALPSGTLSDVGVYLTVYPSSHPNTETDTVNIANTAIKSSTANRMNKGNKANEANLTMKYNTADVQGGFSSKHRLTMNKCSAIDNEKCVRLNCLQYPKGS